MKHLKKFKFFESSHNLTEIEDILKDFTDSGHRVDISNHLFNDYDRLQVFITFLDESGNQTSSNLSDYSESLGHLISYLESDEWNLSSSWMMVKGESGRIQPTVFKLDLNNHTDEVKRIELRFDKYK